jgi:hypothetical protein
MRRERLARGPVARKAVNRGRLADSGGCLLGRKLVFRRTRFKLLQLKLHLVEQVRLALAVLSKELAPHLRNRQTQVRDQSLGAGCLGAHPCELGLAHAHELLQ